MNRIFYNICLFLLAITALNLHAKIIHITDEDTYNNALKSNQQLIVEFSADWCSVCNNIKKPFEEIADEDEFGNVTFVRIDIDKLDNISKQNGVVGVPTFVYLEKGDKKVEEIGVQNLPAFKDHLRENLRKTFKVAQNEPADANIAPIEPTMADITVQDISVEEQSMPEEPNFFIRIIQAITSFFVLILAKIKEFFVTIVDAIKGFFGK